MSKNQLERIKGFLFDLDGVVYLDETVYPGAAEVITLIKEKHLPCRFAANTTTRSLDTLYNKIQRLNLPIEKDELVTPPKLAAEYLKHKGSPTLYLVMDDDTQKDLSGFTISESNPDFIVIGNYAEKWDYKLMNKLFHMMIRGTELLALHKGRYWQTGEGLKLDIGCFVTGLEYVTGKTATVIGKPEPLFFRTALESMGVAPDEAIMIGDDIESDIGGAQRIGMKGILVKTGKYRDELVTQSKVKPDMIIDSIAALKDYL
jgi:HAD superfamily hydrolase (TIGR01458 family)